METRKYHNNDITVTWEPTKCIHSAICFKGLARVFNPKLKPWINMEGADTEAIIKQVNQCPSGAISFKHNKDLENKGAPDNTELSMLKVQVTPGGPLLVHGSFIIEKNNELTTMENKVTALCRCGHSMNKPFCDGSHRKVEFEKHG